MATVDCNACGNLRENAPDFVQNGVTSTICTSLKNDTGLNPNLTVLHNNCEDLDDANDCLVGMMDEQVEAYDVCDWKEFMHKFIPNLHAVIKAEICSMCGEWTNIHKHQSEIEKLQCIVKYIMNGATFRIGEEESDGSYVVAGKGISFLIAQGSDAHTVDVYLQYIAGGLCKGSGSLKWYSEDFTDAGYCWNFDNGSTIRRTRERKGNPLFALTGRYANHGVLLYEMRIKKSQYPQIKALFSGFGQESGGGAYNVLVSVFNGDAVTTEHPTVYAFGNYGSCDEDGNSDGQYTIDGTTYQYDDGHPVPKGWWYVQVRVTYNDMAHGNGLQYTPNYFIGARMNQDEIEC